MKADKEETIKTNIVVRASAKRCVAKVIHVVNYQPTPTPKNSPRIIFFELYLFNVFSWRHLCLMIPLTSSLRLHAFFTSPVDLDGGVDRDVLERVSMRTASRLDSRATGSSSATGLFQDSSATGLFQDSDECT